MRACGFLVLFEGSEVRCIPIPDQATGGVELGESLAQFCRAVLENPDLLNCCLSGLHEHAAGSCARR
jgi:hypothetical protein